MKNPLCCISYGICLSYSAQSENGLIANRDGTKSIMRTAERILIDVVFHQISFSMVGLKWSITVSTGAKSISLVADLAPRRISDKYCHHSVIFLVYYLNSFSWFSVFSNILVLRPLQSVRFFFHHFQFLPVIFKIRHTVWRSLQSQNHWENQNINWTLEKERRHQKKSDTIEK